MKLSAPKQKAPGRVTPWAWAWGPLIGLAGWVAGFFLLPWWAALFLWWWPSALLGGSIGLFLLWLATGNIRIINEDDS
jgi:hypothetical protein